MPIPRRALSDAERRDWLRLVRTENVGPISFKQLLGRYGSAARALDALPEIAARGGRRNFTAPPMATIAREIDAHAKHGAKLLAICEPDYPAYLAAIEDAPPIISAFGDTGLLHKKTVAIVGARNASLNGRKLAEMIARDLGLAGFTVASGLARGIDTAAHRGSLATGTVAVLAGGVDNIYPPENAGLYAEIGKGGCVLAEMPFGSEPRAQHFPRRNRIISGLALGTVVVEAALKSGSLITARVALDQGREVFAVPGSPLDPRALGTNNLIRQGAMLVQSAADVIDALPQGLHFGESAGQDGIAAPPEAENLNELAKIRAQVLENLSSSPTSVDELVRECHVFAPAVLTVLLELELAGRLQRMPGNRVCLIG